MSSFQKRQKNLKKRRKFGWKLLEDFVNKRYYDELNFSIPKTNKYCEKLLKERLSV